MPLPLADAAIVLRAAGLTVVEVDGWKFRGQDDGPFAPQAVMWHHDASTPGDSPAVPSMMANLANNGAQFWVDRAGRWHLVAAGRMWHAGTGTTWGRVPTNQGNAYSAGVETDHTTGEAWPPALLDGLRRGTAALLKWMGANPADSLLGHKEYRSSNPDPHGLDMAHERRVVANLIKNPQGDTMSAADAYNGLAQALKDMRDGKADDLRDALREVLLGALVTVEDGEGKWQDRLDTVIAATNRHAAHAEAQTKGGAG